MLPGRRGSRALSSIPTPRHHTAVDQTQPDSKQPETATDTTPGETAKDDQKLKPETATDAPKPTPARKAADSAKQGVKSNSPPAAPPAEPHD